MPPTTIGSSRRRILAVLVVLASGLHGAVPSAAESRTARGSPPADPIALARALLQTTARQSPSTTWISDPHQDARPDHSLVQTAAGTDPHEGIVTLLDGGDLDGDGAADAIAIREWGGYLSLTDTGYWLDPGEDGRTPAVLARTVELSAISGRTGAPLWGPLTYRSGGVIYSPALYVRTKLNLDGDGTPDVFVYEADDLAGMTRMEGIDGDDGTRLWRLQDPIAFGYVGWAMTVPVGFGDLAGDERAEVVTGRFAGVWNHEESAWTLAVDVRFGHDGSPFGRTRVGTGIGGIPGAGVVGDVAGDAHDDLVVVDAIYNDNNVASPSSGQGTVATARVFTSTEAESPAWSVVAKAAGVSSVAAYPADVVPGGRGEFLIGFGDASTLQAVGEAGRLLGRAEPGGYPDFTLIGDIDGDGYNDIRTTSTYGNDRITTHAWSGAPGLRRIWSHIQTWDMTGAFGLTPRTFRYLDLQPGDFDADGFPDQLAYGCGCYLGGDFELTSGRTGTLLGLWRSEGVQGWHGHLRAAHGSLGGASGDDLFEYTVQRWSSDPNDWSVRVRALEGRPIYSPALWTTDTRLQIWTNRFPGVLTTDLTGDGVTDVIFAFNTGDDSPSKWRHALIALNGATGAILWQR